MCVCVRERETERVRESQTQWNQNSPIRTYFCITFDPCNKHTLCQYAGTLELVSRVSTVEGHLATDRL